MGQSPCRRPQTAKFRELYFQHTEKEVRNAIAFRGGANKTAPPFFIVGVNLSLKRSGGTF